MMEIALIEYFPQVGFEVWITNFIEIDAGLGDVFDTREEALQYVKDHDVPFADLSYMDMPYLEGDELRNHLRQFVDIGPNGEVLSIKPQTEWPLPSTAKF